MHTGLLSHIDCTFLSSSLHAVSVFRLRIHCRILQVLSYLQVMHARVFHIYYCLYICQFLLIPRCLRLGLQPLAYLWHRDQESLLAEMISSNLHAILIKVAAFGEHFYFFLNFHIIKRVIPTGVCSFVSVCVGAMSKGKNLDKWRTEGIIREKESAREREEQTNALIINLQLSSSVEACASGKRIDAENNMKR